MRLSHLFRQQRTIPLKIPFNDFKQRLLDESAPWLGSPPEKLTSMFKAFGHDPFNLNSVLHWRDQARSKLSLAYLRIGQSQDGDLKLGIQMRLFVLLILGAGFFVFLFAFSLPFICERGFRFNESPIYWAGFGFFMLIVITVFTKFSAEARICAETIADLAKRG